MTTEELRLEVQVMVKDAIKNLSGASDEVKRLAKEAKAAVPPANELKDTMARLQRDLKTTESAAGLFGDTLGGLKDRQALLKGAMLDLLDKGITPSSKEIQDLKLEYDAAGVAAKDIEKQNELTSGSFVDLQSSIGGIAAVKAFQTLVSGVVSLGVAAVGTAGRYEMLQANFETLTGSAAAASAEFKSLRQFANVTPFSLEGTAAAAQQLQAAKTPISELNNRLGQLGDLSLGNQQKFTSMVGAFSKMSVKGKVDLEQMNVFMEAGVPILDELAKGYGKTETAVFDMMSKGEVKTADFIAAMKRMTSEGGQFFGGMARGAKAWEGIWSTYQDSVDSVSGSFGELLLPAAKAIFGILTQINAAISESPVLQGLLAGTIVTLTIVLGILAVKMALSTAKTWLAYAAKMALNAAQALGNPILIAGIAAVGLATAGYVIYAAAQNKAADATNEMASSLDTANKAAKAYRDSLKSLSSAELETAAAQLKSQLAKAGGRLGTSQADAWLKAIVGELDARNAAAKAALDEKAAAWRADWRDDYAKFQAEQSSDPYAAIEYEKRKKLDEAAANGMGKANQETIDEINAYFMAKRKNVADSISKDEQDRLAKLTATKIDDLELEKAATISAFKGSEAARAAIAGDYDRQIAEARTKESAEAAAALFDLQNKSRSSAVALSESKLDDLEYEAERALALFEGTEDGKLALAESYARKIADAQIEEDKRVFLERVANAKVNGEYGSYAALTAEDAAKGTQVGQLAGFGGAAAADPIALLVELAIEFAMSLDSVNQLLNGLSTMLEGVAEIVDPLLSQGTGDLIDSLVDVGRTLAESLAPGLSILVLGMKLASGIINILIIPALKLVGIAFSWLNDHVVVPFGNGIIFILNAVITGINKALGWLGVHIATIAYLQTTAQLASAQEAIAKKTEDVSKTMSDVRDLFDERKEELKDAYDKNVGALQNLLELGAISASDYQARLADAKESYSSSMAALDSAEKAQLKTLQDILDALNEGNNISAASLHAAGVPGYAVGAIEIPQTQAAIVHAGETIIPASFAEGLRNGELSLSKASSTSTIIYQTSVTVEGSVTTEDGLADRVATKINRRMKRGQLEMA